jgi:predicted transcriptional regulator
MINIMATTIQLKETTKDKLDKMKLYRQETYNEVLERLIEDVSDLNLKTREELETAIKEIESGKWVSLEKLAKELGF